MQPKAQQVVSASIFALALVFGATACTASGPASPGGASAGGQSAPAQALRDTVASIQEYATSDMNPQEGQDTTPAEEKVNSNFDPSMDAAKRNDVVLIFADILSADPNATVEVNQDNIAVDGKTAIVEASDLKITIRGQEHKASGGGTLTMTEHDGKWLISDVSFPEDSAAGSGGDSAGESGHTEPQGPAATESPNG